MPDYESVIQNIANYESERKSNVEEIRRLNELVHYLRRQKLIAPINVELIMSTFMMLLALGSFLEGDSSYGFSENVAVLGWDFIDRDLTKEGLKRQINEVYDLRKEYIDRNTYIDDQLDIYRIQLRKIMKKINKKGWKEYLKAYSTRNLVRQLTFNPAR